MSSSAAFRSEGAERPSRVLVVDDDRLGTEVRAELIRMSGFSVDVAFSGTEALAKASICDFDIFLIDYDMPGMNGLELAMELREQNHRAPIAMLSGRLEPPK
jgi:two-component system alkaline phosphatase synthesis response regulator PhoP